MTHFLRMNRHRFLWAAGTLATGSVLLESCIGHPPHWHGGGSFPLPSRPADV